MAGTRVSMALAGALVAVACTPNQRQVDVLATLPVGLDALLPVPADSPLCRARVELGRRLFHDPRLSRDGSVSCASCHREELEFTDGRQRSVGIGGRIGRRNTPSLLNAAYRRSMFWDGRETTLERQALLPLANPDEMGHTVAGALLRLRADPSYAPAFEAAFGAPEITARDLARALASFQRTLVAGDTPYDRGALSPGQRRGQELFEGRARCRLCHEGGLFTDGLFHNTGVGFGGEPRDLGRYEVTGIEADRGRFRTPSLRGVARTAPYMHDGSLATLPDVVEFYDRGAGRNPHLDQLLRPLLLTAAEKADLAAFLASLSQRPTSQE